MKGAIWPLWFLTCVGLSVRSVAYGASSILKELALKIKKEHTKKKYDVVVGVSGGTDSSYMLYLAKEVLGLRPLAAHFDNTWNSKIAVETLRAR